MFLNDSSKKVGWIESFFRGSKDTFIVTEFPKGNTAIIDSTKITMLTLSVRVPFFPCMLNPLTAFLLGGDIYKAFLEHF
jgi:hypothetical protein